MLDRIVHESICCLLVNDILSVLVLDHRPAHAAVSEDADNVAVTRVCPICHFAFTSLWRSLSGGALASGYAAQSGCDDAGGSCSLEELSSVYILFHSLDLLMNFMTFHMDGGKRPCRAEVLACSAADASLFVYNRDSQ